MSGTYRIEVVENVTYRSVYVVDDSTPKAGLERCVAKKLEPDKRTQVGHGIVAVLSTTKYHDLEKKEIDFANG